MVNGKIIFGTLSILAALVAFFETLGDMRTSTDYVPIIPFLLVFTLGISGIMFVRRGITKKRKAS